MSELSNPVREAAQALVADYDRSLPLIDLRGHINNLRTALDQPPQPDQLAFADLYELARLCVDALDRQDWHEGRLAREAAVLSFLRRAAEPDPLAAAAEYVVTCFAAALEAWDDKREGPGMLLDKATRMNAAMAAGRAALRAYRAVVQEKSNG